MNWYFNDFFLFNYSFSNNWNFFNLFDWAIDFKIDVSDLLDFDWLVDIDYFIYNFFNNFNCRYLHDFLNNNFNYLRYLYDFLNYSWHDYDLLDNLFDLDDFRNLDKFVHYFLNSDFNLLYSFDNSWHFDDLLHNAVDNLNVFNVLDVRLFYLNNLRFLNYLFFNALNRYNVRNMYSLNYNFNYLDWNSHDSILKDRDLNLSLYSLNLLNNIFDYDISNLFYFSWYNFLNNLINEYLDSLDYFHCLFDNYRDLYSLRDVDDLGNDCFDRHYFLDVDWYFH